MIFTQTPLKDAVIIDIEKRLDERWFFARTWCAEEFEKNGIFRPPVQSNMSFTKNKWTMRGMHYQLWPNAESKLVRCTRGSVYDVIVDIREDSLTFGKWFWVELSDVNCKMLFVPEWFAHGFLTLSDNVEFIYQVSEFYSPQSERWIRYDDPSFGIEWPWDVLFISDKDLAHPNYIFSK